jgi:hypothetical protein
MTKPMVRIHNTETNEIIDREMTDEELVNYNKKIDLYNADKATREAAEAKAATDKAALLTKLGITAEEAALLLS